MYKKFIAKALQKWKQQCRSKGVNLVCLYTLVFADNQVVIADDKDDLECMPRKLQKEY